MTRLVWPKARRTDPATSHKAAAAKPERKRSQRTILLETYAEYTDLTDEEAAEAAEAAGEDVGSEYATRCSELRRSGFIAPTGKTSPGKSGTDRIVCEITEAGLDELERS